MSFRFIRFMRFCKKDETTFLRTQCRAKMRRSTTYNIDLSVDEQGNILQTQCECAAGMGPYAFPRTQCRVKMRRGTTYNIDLSVDEQGNILQTQCECAAGMGPYAHCKHIRAALLPVIDYGCGKAMKLEITCTETVQSFHRPCRLHNGSPVKAEHLGMSMNNTNIIFNPIPQAQLHQLLAQL